MLISVSRYHFILISSLLLILVACAQQPSPKELTPVASTPVTIIDEPGNVYPAPSQVINTYPAPEITADPIVPITIQSEFAVVFASDRDGSPRYFIMELDGSNVQKLNLGNFSADADIELPVWSKEQQRFYYSVTIGGDADIYSSNLDGSDLINITDTTSQFESQPVISPDGSQIAFVFVELDLDIGIMNTDGSNRINLTLIPARDTNPIWMPDGSSILFLSNRQGTPNGYLSNLDGSEIKNISNGKGQDSFFAISPDGGRVAFQSDRDRLLDIFIVTLADLQVFNLTKTTDQRERQPVWSPDGTKLAYSVEKDGKWDLFAISADGSGLVQLTHTPDVREFNYVWSPDGSKVLFSAEEDNGNSEVYTVDISSGMITNLTNHPSNDSVPVIIQLRD